MKDKTIKANEFSIKILLVRICLIVSVLVEICSLLYWLLKLIIFGLNNEDISSAIPIFVATVNLAPLLASCSINNKIKNSYIEFRQKDIYVPGPRQRITGVLQYEMKVEYRKIIGIDLTYSHHNSLYSEPCDMRGAIGSENLSYKPYIDIYTTERKVERILLRYYTKKQWKEILTQIKLRVSKHNTMLDDMDIDKMLKNFKFTFREKNPYDNFKELIEKYNEAKRQK